jgi:hypothetical protein
LKTVARGFIPECRVDFIAFRLRYPIQVHNKATPSPPNPIASDVIVSTEDIVDLSQFLACSDWIL